MSNSSIYGSTAFRGASFALPMAVANLSVTFSSSNITDGKSHYGGVLWVFNASPFRRNAFLNLNLSDSRVENNSATMGGALVASNIPLVSMTSPGLGPNPCTSCVVSCNTASFGFPPSMAYLSTQPKQLRVQTSLSESQLTLDQSLFTITVSMLVGDYGVVLRDGTNVNRTDTNKWLSVHCSRNGFRLFISTSRERAVSSSTRILSVSLPPTGQPRSLAVLFKLKTALLAS